MATYLKPVLLLLVSAVLFFGFAFLADAELFNYVHTRFYNPSVVNSFIKENRKDAEIVQNHINELQNRFAATLNETAIRSSFLYNQSAADIFERSRIYGMLLETAGGLQSVQFIDSNGIRIHYSTSSRDIVSQNRESTAYRNYTEDSRALPYDSVSVPAYGNSKFTMDDSYDRIIFSYPFYDSMDVYRGTALFTLSVRALAEKLIAEGRLKANDDVSIIRLPPGIVSGSPDTSKANILGKVSAIWSNGYKDHVILDAEESGVRLALISTRTDQNLFFGRLVNSSIFFIPDSMKFLFKLSMFLTFYLVVFFLINLRPNPASLVNNRIKTLRTNLFEQLYVNKDSKDRAKWLLELEQRRDEIRAELKHGLRMNRAVGKNIDEIIDRAWDELLAVIKSGSGVVVYDVKPAQTAEKAETAPDVSDAEEIEEVEEVEALEEIDEAGEVEDAEEAEELEDIEEIEEVEEIAEAEELTDENEEPDELDNLIDGYEQPPAATSASKGLLRLATEIEEYIEEAENTSHPVASSGLLKLASKIEEAGGVQKAEAFEEETLEALEEVETLEDIEELEVQELPPEEPPPSAPPAKKGLLALADKEKEEEEEETSRPVRGLLALASEIEFNNDIKVREDNTELDAELNIVSPFSSMFTGLDSDVKEET